MILLSGATGKTGQALVDLFMASGRPARALVRDAAKAGDLHARGLETVIGDLQDDQALAAAMAGVERAFLLMANAPDQCALEKRFIDAARAAGVPHVVKFSAIGADAQSPAVLKRYHGEAEDHLRQSGLTYTIVQGNFFMDNLLNSAATIARDNRFSLPMGAGRAGVVDVRDMAEAVFAVLTETGHDNRTYLVTGAEILSFGDIAEILSAVLGRPVSYVDVPEDAAQAQLLGAGLPEWYVNAVLELFALHRLDRNAVVTDTFAELTGRQPRTLRQFVEHHAARFS